MPIKIGDLTLYDVEELSQLLKIHPRTIRLLFSHGKIKGRKLAKKWYCSEADLKAYFNQTDTVER